MKNMPANLKEEKPVMGNFFFFFFFYMGNF